MSEKEINPKATTTAKTRARKTATKKAETIDAATFEQDSKNLPSTAVLKDSKGGTLALTIENINTLGTDVGTGIGKLSDDILRQVNLADDNTEFGKSVSTILTLTRKVDIESLSGEQTGIVAKFKNLFKDVKHRVSDQLTNSHEQIQEVMGTLETGIMRMRNEADWLKGTYDANVVYLKELEEVVANIQEVREVEDAKLNAYLADSSTEMHVLDHQKMVCEALSKQEDKINRLINLCQLNAPQIMAMRGVNINTIDKFESLKSIVIPAWKNKIAQGLITDRQRRDNELGEMMDAETNRLFLESAKQISTNMVTAAKSAQRGVVDIKTIREVQKTTIQGIKDTIAVQKAGEAERQAAKKEMEHMRLELRDTLRNISEEARK